MNDLFSSRKLISIGDILCKTDVGEIIKDECPEHISTIDSVSE